MCLDSYFEGSRRSVAHVTCHSQTGCFVFFLLLKEGDMQMVFAELLLKQRKIEEKKRVKESI